MDTPDEIIGGSGSGEALLRHRAFVQRLARSLARDADEARELEQEAWLAALRRSETDPHRGDADSPAWLARALRARARTRRRSGWRRAERERRAARPEASGGDAPDELVARLEEAQRLVAAVLALSEPRRRVVLLFYERGLSTRAIAAREGLPEGTVRTHLFRAREELRERLDRGPGGRAAWVALLAPGESMARAGAPAAALASAGGTWMAKVLVASVVTAMAAGLWLGWPPSERVEAEGAAVVGERGEGARSLAHGSAPAEPEPVAARAAEDAPRRATPAPPPAPGWWLVGELAGPPDEDPPRMQVELRAAGEDELLLAATTGRALELALDEALAEREQLVALRARVDHPDFIPAENWLELPADLALAPGERRELRLDLELRPAAGFVEGTVQAPFAAEGADVLVALFRLDDKGHLVREPVEQLLLAPPASYRLRAAETGRHVLLAAERERSVAPSAEHASASRPETRALELGGGATQRADLLLGLGERISGRVVDALGRPLAGARVSARPAKGLRGVDVRGLVIGWADGRFERTGSSAAAEALGRFELTGLGAEEYSLSAYAGTVERELGPDGRPIPWTGFSEGATADGVEVRISAPAADVELAISTFSARIEVVSGGEPVPEPQVAILWPGGNGTSGSRGNERGELGLHGQGGSAFGLRVSKPGFLPRTFELPRDVPRDAEIWRIELEPGPAPATVSLELGVEGAEDPLRVIWRFERASEGEPASLDSLERTQLDFMDLALSGGDEWPADGHLELGPLDPGRYRLHLDPQPPRGEETFLLPVELELELLAGARDERSLRFPLGGRLRVFAPTLPDGSSLVIASIVDAAGARVSDQFAFQAPGGGLRTSSALGEGMNELTTPLPPGRYELLLNPRRPDPIRVPFELEPGRTTDLRLDDQR